MSRKLRVAGKLLLEVIILLYIILFVYAAASKLLDYGKFRLDLGQSPMLTSYAGWVAWMVPAIEISVAVMLLIRRWRLPALYAAFGLMIMFTTYIIVITRFSSFVPCSCGGVLQHMTWNQHLMFNIFFALLALAGIVLYQRQPSEHPAL